MPRNQTTFTKERPGPGAPRLTPEQRKARKIEREAMKAAVFDLKQRYAELLPKGVEAIETILNMKTKTVPVLRLKKDTVTEMSDRLYGKPPQAITGSGGGPLVVSFTELLNGVDGNKAEKF